MKNSKDFIELEKNLYQYSGKDRIISSWEAKKHFDDNPLKATKFYSSFQRLNDLTDGFSLGELIVIGGITGEGKCFGKGTKVLMYNGKSKEVENIKVGDKIMGNDSTPRTVLSLGRGKEMMYKISLRDGSSFICNESHILTLKRTRTNKWRYDNKKGERRARKDRKGEVKNISVREYLTSSNGFKHLYKMYKTGVDFAETELPIEPYFVGLWLGDGTATNVGVTTADKEIVDYIYEYAEKLELQVTVIEQEDNKANIYSITREKRFPSKYKAYKRGFGGMESLQTKLKGIKLLGNKHIPSDYKINSEENRLKLLAGLIDSDGYYNSPGTMGFCNKNKRLCEDLVFLCRSLGFYASIKKPKIIKDVEYQRVYISGALQKIPILLKRKLPIISKGFYDVLARGFKIEKIGLGDYYGFEIDGNNLFLLADFTVVHNTSLAKSLTRDYAKRDIKCLWFSFEIPLRYFIKQYQIVPKFYAPAEITKINLEWLETRIVESLTKFTTRVIFIDHLHFLLPMTTDSDKLIGGVMRKLKLMALKYNICIVLMCHVTKDAFDRPLRLSDLRGSSFISQEADYVLLIWRKKNPDTHGKFEYLDMGIVKVAKNRRNKGRLGSLGVKMSSDRLFVEEGL